MRYFLINKNLDAEVAKDFLTEVNNHPSEAIKIYLTSHGGAVSCSNMMLDIIATEPSRFTIVALEEIHSAAFSLFFRANCKRVIGPDLLASYHLTRKEISMSDTGQPYYDFDLFYMHQNKERVKDHDRFCQILGMTAVELKTMADCEDIVFTTARLQQMLAASEKHFEEKWIERGIPVGGPIGFGQEASLYYRNGLDQPVSENPLAAVEQQMSTVPHVERWDLEHNDNPGARICPSDHPLNRAK